MPRTRTLLAAPLQTHHVFCGLLAPSSLDDRWPQKVFSFRRATSESLGTQRDSSRFRPPYSYRCQASQGSRCLTDRRLSRLVNHQCGLHVDCPTAAENCEHKTAWRGPIILEPQRFPDSGRLTLLSAGSQEEGLAGDSVRVIIQVNDVIHER